MWGEEVNTLLPIISAIALIVFFNLARVNKVMERSQVNVNCPKGLDEKDYLDLRAKYLTLHNSYLDSSTKLEECNRRLKSQKADLDYAYSRIEVLSDPPQAYCPPCDTCEEKEEE